MRSFITQVSGLFLLVAFAGCGTVDTQHLQQETDIVSITGIVEVLAAGTRSESVIITDEASGEVFALVGEKAYDMVPEYGQLTAVRGRLTEEGYCVRMDLQKVYVIDYSIISVEDMDDY